jgi:hypothetical protein
MKTKKPARCEYEGGGNGEAVRCKCPATHAVTMFKLSKSYLCADHAREIVESYPSIASNFEVLAPVAMVS